jgi:hypothetical protein
MLGASINRERDPISQHIGTPVFRQICGFYRPSGVPSEATFSRAFEEFAETGLGERVHESMVAQYVKPELVGHISRDATAIQGWEKARKKPRPPKPAPRKRGRPPRGEVREPKPDTRLERQWRQSAVPYKKYFNVIVSIIHFRWRSLEYIFSPNIGLISNSINPP